MTVQAPAPAAQEFFQTLQPVRAGDCNQDTASPDGGSGDEFKKLLLSMRQAKNGEPGKISVNKKSPAPAALKSAEQAGERGVFWDIETPGDENRAEGQVSESAPDERAKSRFDPDVILGAPRETEDGAGETPAKSAESAEDAENDGEEAPSGDETLPPGECREAPIREDVPVPNVSLCEIDAEAASAVLPRAAEKPDGKKDVPSGEVPLTDDTSDKTALAGARGVLSETAHETGAGAKEPITPDGRPEENSAPADVPKPPSKDAAEAADNYSGETGKRFAVPREKSEKTGSGAVPVEKPSARRISADFAYGTEGPARPAASADDSSARAVSGPDIRPASSVYSLRSGDKFGEGLTSVVELMNRNDLPEARVVVEPPALGRIDVALRATPDGMEAFFRVENEDLKQMVQFHLDSLKTSLQAQGIHVSALTVDIRNNEGQKGRDSGAPKKGRAARLEDGGGDAAEDMKIARLDLENGLLHWVA